MFYIAPTISNKICKGMSVRANFTLGAKVTTVHGTSQDNLRCSLYTYIINVIS